MIIFVIHIVYVEGIFDSNSRWISMVLNTRSAYLQVKIVSTHGLKMSPL